ncbi:MAG: glycosyltransferase family 2 protein [Bacteroidota bacterium]
MTDLSIIIVCYKGWERLIKCLESLDLFTGENFSTEVIVVDNRSDDEIILEIEKRFPKFRFIYNKINGGYANGCNLGCKYAEGKFFLILNPDTVASECELEKLLNTAKKNPAFTILSCRQVNENGRESIASGQFPHLFNLTGFQRAIFGKRNLQSEIIFPDWISGSVVLMQREIFQKLGGFDEDFWMYFEDVDLCRRVRNIPGKIAFCSNITIEHNHGGSSRINLKTASLTKTEVHISKHLYISKHKSGMERVLIQTFLVINNLISGGLMALLGLVFFFVPKLFARALIYLRLISYYTGSLFRLSWISPRSVNFRKIKTHAPKVQG